MQKSEHITYRQPRYGVFRNGLVHDPEDVTRLGKVINSYKQDGSPFTSSGPGDVSYLDVAWSDDKHDLARLSDTVYVEQWSYDGLEYIKTGDRLTIFQQGVGSLALWSGGVVLEKQDPYARDSFSPGGFLACHNLPLQTEPLSQLEWAGLFIEQHWATLLSLKITLVNKKPPLVSSGR